MNIFVEDDDGESGAIGLSGNKANTVLHTSFTSNRVSTDEASSVDSGNTQSSAGQTVGSLLLSPSHARALTPQTYAALEYPAILPNSSLNSGATINPRPRSVPSTSSEVLRTRGVPQARGSPRIGNEALIHQQFARQQPFLSQTAVQQPSMPQSKSQELTSRPTLQLPTSLKPTPQQPNLQSPVPRQSSLQSTVSQDRAHQQQTLPQSAMEQSVFEESISQKNVPQHPIMQKPTQQEAGRMEGSKSMVLGRDIEPHEVIHESKSKIQSHAVDKGESKERIQECKASMRTNAPRSFGGLGEDITAEESDFAAKVQKMIDKDDEHIKLDMKLSDLSIKHQPTAEDAVKARGGISKEELATEMKIDIKNLEENERKLDVAEQNRSSMNEDVIAVFGLVLDADSLMDDAEPLLQPQFLDPNKDPIKTKATGDFFDSLSNYPEIMMEIAKFLRPRDFVKVYSISTPFNEIIGSYLSHTLQLAAKMQAPESATVFRFKFYGDLCQFDPASRPDAKKHMLVRSVPSPRWLQMVVHRDRTIRDILALMARQGHRMPKDMSLSLKKMWLIMDVATSRQRIQLLHSPYFTDKDIYNMQMFIVKLDMRFNDPFDGPGSDKLRKLMLGQRGLTPLCKLLKREIGKTEMEVTKMGIRYAYLVEPKFRGMPLFDIPPEEIGIGHLEGWGKGIVHLYRPDELVVREAVRRRLKLKNHILGMMIWGYVDPRTGENIKVTDEEMYISEDESESEEYEVWNDDWETDSDREGIEIPEAMSEQK